MENEEKNAGRQDDSASESIKQGKKAIDMQKTLNPNPPEKMEKDQKQDAENWRNEG